MFSEPEHPCRETRVMTYPKIVRDAHYHIWTDALHGRALAHQARNDWDRGTYVRWTVASAWTALETACDDALGVSGIGRRFKENLDAELARRVLPRLEWGSGIWQQVGTLQSKRVSFVHLTVDQSSLFPAADEADKAIQTTRQAIRDIYQLAGKAAPEWLQDDGDRGWHARLSDRAVATVVRAGVDRDDPRTISIGFVLDGTEHVDSYLPPDTDVEEALKDLKQRLQVPVKAVFARRGDKTLAYEEIPWRGA